MFRRTSDRAETGESGPERVDSVLGAGITWQGAISGQGGVRIDGAFDGEIAVRGLVVVGEGGRVTCEHIRALTVVVAGSVKGNVTAKKVEIAPTGRIWGDVVTTTFSTAEGAFLRGKIRMEEKLDIGLGPERDTPEADAQAQAAGDDPA